MDAIHEGCRTPRATPHATLARRSKPPSPACAGEGRGEGTLAPRVERCQVSHRLGRKPQRLYLNGERLSLKPERLWLKPERLSLKPERLWLKPERLSLKPERLWLKPERLWLKPERLWLKPERLSLKPERQ